MTVQMAADPSLKRFGALARSSREDRMTEALALALSLDPSLARGQPLGWDADEVPKITCQMPTEKGKQRVDLALTGRDSALWIEAKVDSAQRDGQLVDYAKALIEKGTPGSLIYLTRPGAGEKEVEQACEELDADQLELISIRALDWQTLADQMQTAHNDSRVLEMLRRYMKEEGVYVKQMNEQLLDALRLVPDAKTSLWNLFSGVREALSEHEGLTDPLLPDATHPRKNPEKKWDQFPFCHANVFPTRVPGWPDNRAAAYVWLEFCFSVKFEATPAFFAGLTLVGDPESDFDLALADTVAVDNDLKRIADDKYIRLYKTLPLQDEGDVGDQTKGLAEAVVCRFENLIEDHRITELCMPVE